MGMREARRRAGMKVADVARIMNVSEACVYQWETGATFPRTDKLIKLATLYRVTVDELLKGA